MVNLNEHAYIYIIQYVSNTRKTLKNYNKYGIKKSNKNI